MADAHFSFLVCLFSFLIIISLSCGHVGGGTGLVTDGSVRDTDILREYGFPVFSHSTTAKQGPAAMQPWEANGVVECGGVVVRPGDAIIGDQDGETLLALFSLALVSLARFSPLPAQPVRVPA